MDKPYVTAAILAAGIGSRMQSSVTKQKMLLSGKSVIRRAVDLFCESSFVDDIIVVVREDEKDFVETELEGVNKPYKLVVGGKFRAESARNAFLALEPKANFIAIHDAARCLTAKSDIEAVINDAFKFGAATATREVFDTVKEIDEQGFIKQTKDRSFMRFAETPQVFLVELYKQALDTLGKLDASITDDNMLMEKVGKQVFATKMTKSNLKITTKSDITYAEFILKGNTGNE